MEWSWPAWMISAGAVVASGLMAWIEGNWSRRPGLGMGFANHGGMWGDLALLSSANAVIVPHLTRGPWIAGAIAASGVASLLVHRYWYSPAGGKGDHMWPAHTHGHWHRDLSAAGWAHVLYVTGELTLLAGFAFHDVPADVVLFIAIVFTIHLPLGLLQPRHFLTGHVATVTEQPLLAPLLLTLWTVAALKL